MAVGGGGRGVVFPLLRRVRGGGGGFVGRSGEGGGAGAGEIGGGGGVREETGC